jgi:small nuclear ribonucleoprotein (snRNP)-like protein
MAAQTEASAAASSKYQPSDFLKAVLGRPVIVKLNSGVSYRGILACLDGYMNIAMEQTEEYARAPRPPRARARPRPPPAAGRRPAQGQVRRLLHPREQRCVRRRARARARSHTGPPPRAVHYISTIRRPKA